MNAQDIAYEALCAQYPGSGWIESRAELAGEIFITFIPRGETEEGEETYIIEANGKTIEA